MRLSDPSTRVGLALASATLALGTINGAAQEVTEAPRAVAPESLQRPRLRAMRAREPIRLDGVLDEPSWSLADSTDGTLWTTQPVPGIPAQDRTVLRVLFDDDAIYVGARVYDSEPHRAVSAGLEQDFAVTDSDLLGIAIDAARDRQSSFTFASNPAGATWDAQSFGDGATINAAWEGIFEVETTMDGGGWWMEMRIPVTTLRFPKGEGEQVWGFNVSRQTKRRNEYATWAAIPRQFRVFRMSMAGTLEGLPQFDPGLNLQVKPFVTASRVDGSIRPDGRVDDADVGLDAKWAVTPQLTLDLTALTDFSQVEVDAEQVNLTRFSLFFPEKRDFFLENDGIFTFADDASRAFRSGSGPQNFKLFHSRRIGLSPAREPLPIGGGARLSGRIGRYEIGLMEMQTLSEGDAVPENFAVARMRRSFHTASDVGFMLVNRQATGANGGAYSRAGGFDANLRLARLQVNAYVAATDAPGDEDDPTTAMVQLGWRDPVFNFSVLGKHVGEDFAPAAGFVSRTGVDQWFASGGVHLQQLLPGVQEVNPYVDVTEYHSTVGDGLQTREISPGLVVAAADGGRFTAEYVRTVERLATPESILGVTLPAGRYEYGLTTVGYTSNSGRLVSGSIRASTGDFFDGDRRSISGTLSIRPSAHLWLQGSVQRNRLNLAGERVDADLVAGRVRYGYDTRTFLSAFVQYNRVARELITNVRFNLIHAPLSDVFIVYSERRQTDPMPGAWPILDRGLTLKVTRLLQF